MSRPTRTKVELQSALRHICYEAWMLERTAEMLPPIPNLEKPRDRAVLESFVIHTRNLLDFLYKGEGKNYIAPEHFIDANVWHNQRPPKSALLKKAHIRANNDVAHLTYERLANSHRNDPWPVPEITKEIVQAYSVFQKLAQIAHPHCAPSQHQPNVISVSVSASFHPS